MTQTHFFSALIVAGGSGMRMQNDLPKQFHLINDISIIEQCIKTFYSCKNCIQIRVVCDPRHDKMVQDMLLRYSMVHVSTSGRIRKDSVYNGLYDFSDLKYDDIILIHDAARPMVSCTDIDALVNSAAANSAATLAVPVADTLTRIDGSSVDRADLWTVQTPQGFRYGLIREAHEKFKDNNDFTDDASLVRALGHAVKLVPGNRQNFKITTPDDLEMARKLMTNCITESRTALGFDVHAFDPSKPGPIRLGGVDIDHPCRLSGHSDADVGLHALTDALLGTIAAGDIGQHFPPSDPQWKGADSAVFLKHAVGLVAAKGGKITFLDLTFLCEAPKIGPARAAMQSAISRITGLSPDRISIKATTTEKLGFTGRGEGIATQALATIELPKTE